jgi:phosphoribosylanthranilate isomerase
MTYIKICGITNMDDAAAAVDAGADLLGFNFYKPSPRYITPQKVREIVRRFPSEVLKVGVFVNEELADAQTIMREAGLGAIQLHGDESPEYCSQFYGWYVIKTFAVTDTFDVHAAEAYEVDAIMLDTKHNQLRGGTGRVFDWSIAREAALTFPELYLAGGLSPENVENAIKTVRPFAVDACSALEDSPGKKNHERMRVFINTVRGVAP